MSYIGTTPEETRVLDRRQDELLVLILKELRLLNTRLEEAFDTQVSAGDIADEI